MALTKNYIARARRVKVIVDEHYEPGNNRRCLRQVWRHEVMPVYPMSERTFRRMVSLMAGVDGYIGKGGCRVSYPLKDLPDVQGNNPRQMSLF